MDWILIIIATLILCVSVYKLYEPRIDIVKEPNNFVVLLWYNKYMYRSTVKRTYKRLFTV